MDFSLNHSFSEKSYSPPVSQASTRDTTPDFDPSTAVSGIPSLQIGGVTMEASHPLRNEPQRRGGEKAHAMFRRFNQQPQQTPMRHVLANAAAPRTADAPSWRMGMGIGLATVQGQVHGHYHSLNSTSGLECMAIGSPVPERQAADMSMDMGIDTTGFYAYCFDRGNGNYTRLIPADLLPSLVGIPAVQHSAEGMLVLPSPRGLDPQNPPGNPVQPVAFKTPPPSPALVSDALQKRIDHIVASSPVPPKKAKIYCDKWVHEGVCAFTQQGCKYKHEMPLDKATQHSLGLFHGLPTWWKKQQAELQRLQQDNGNTEVFFDPHQQQQSGLSSPMKSERGLASPSRASQSWRRADGARVQSQMISMSPVGHNGACRPPAELRSPYQQNMNTHTSPCVWGPIGPPSKQASDHSQMYHQTLGNFNPSSNFAMLSSLDTSMSENVLDSRFGSF